MSGNDAAGTRFVVQWEEHPSHLASRLGGLLEQQALVDVTLMCNTHTLRVHRTVLAACSPYFEHLLKNISQRQLVQHPLIVLKDMQFSVLKCMIEFMYCGETNVTEDDLGPLLQAARFFQVKGLSSMTKEALGLPPRTAVKSKVNGEVPKSAPKPGPKAVSTPLAPKPASGPNMPGLSMISKQQPIKSFAVRESPGLRSVSNDPAELLLSLSADTGNQNKTTTYLSQPAKMPAGITKQVVTSQQRSWTTRPIGAAVDSSFQLAPNQPEGASPVYQPGPRKRGRPLKRQMNLVFQEKLLTDTDLALRKEAEASRRALETLQKEMSHDDDEVKIVQQIRHVSVKQPSHVQKQPNLVMKSKLVPVPQQHKIKTAATVSSAAAKQSPATSTAAVTLSAPVTPAAAPVTPAPTPAPTSVPTPTPITPTPEVSATVTETELAKKEDTSTTNVTVEEAEADSGTITYQISDTGSGSVMSHYMEVLKDAGLPTDVPILIDSGDGNYVTVNEEVLLNIVNGGGLSYQVTTEQLHEVRKQQDGDQLLVTAEDDSQLQQQVVRYVDDNGDIVEGVLAVVQEGDEGTTVAVTPSGQVLQIQAAVDGETYQFVEATTTSNTEDIISADLEPTAQQEEEAAPAGATKRASEEIDNSDAVKKMKVEETEK